MRLTAIRILLLLNAALAAVLALSWFQRDGTLRNTRWSAPPAIAPTLKGLVPDVPSSTSEGDVRDFLATLERPLFSSTRRPPPPPAPPKAPPPPPPPDPLASLRIYGIFGAGDSGGIIANRDGKDTVIRVRDRIGAWTVKSVEDRTVTLTNGAETRVLRLPTLTALPATQAAPTPAPTPRGRPR
jgi:hypothetical protein